MERTINKLKKARAIYIHLKEQHCQKSILEFWGNECIRLRQKLKSNCSDDNSALCGQIPNSSNQIIKEIKQ